MAAGEHEQVLIEPAAASAAVAALLTGPPQPAELIAEFPVARYLRVGEDVIALVTPEAVRLPNSLVCRALPPNAGSAPVVVGDGRVRIGGARVTVGRWWDPVPRVPRVPDVSALGRAVETMGSLLPAWPEAGEPAADQLVAGREALVSALAGEGTVVEAADHLVGLGPGLTPAGDDLLAGAVAGSVIFGRVLDGRFTLNAAEQVAAAVTARADRTTVLAANLARHAATGAVAEPVGEVCGALAGQRPLEAALERLLAVGHTSGRDLAEGLLLGTTAALGTR